MKLAVALLLFASCHSTPAPTGPRPPPNFAVVRVGLYRGGHPDSRAFDYLATLHVRTIVNLEIADLVEATEEQIREEDAFARAHGMIEVHVPISAFEPALSQRFDRLIDRALSTIEDPASAPVYVHCLHGQDRTGLVVGLERVLDEHWTPDAAYTEMTTRGFHPMFLGLADYFRRRTDAD